MLYKKILIAITILSFSFGSNFIRVSEFKGLDTKTAPDKIQQNRATDITNLDFDVMGSLQTRKGIEYLNTYPDNIRNINDRAVNNMIYDNSIEYKGFIGSYNVSQYTNIGDDIYFFGNDMVVWKDNLSLYTQIGANQPNDLDGEIIISEDGKLSGTYNYAITYVYDDKESNPYYLRSEITENYNLNNAFFAVGVTPNRFFMKSESRRLFGYSDSNRKLLLNNYYSSFTKYLKYEEGSVLMADFNDNFYKINPTTIKIDNTYSFSLQAEYPDYALSRTDWSPSTGLIYNSKYIAGSTIFMDRNDIYIVVVLATNYRGRYRPPGSSITYKEAYLTDVTIECVKITNYTTKEKIFSQSFGTLGDIYYYPSPGSIRGTYVESDVVYFLYGTSLYRSSDFSSQNKSSFFSSGSFHDYLIGGSRYLGQKNIFNWTTNIEVPVNNNNQYIQMSIDSDRGYILSQNLVDIYNIDTVTPTINFITSDSWSLTLDNTALFPLNQKVLLTLPTLDALATGINLYRQWNGTGYYFLDNIVAGNTEYIDNIGSLEQSVVPMEIDNNSPPPAIDSEYIVARQFYLAPDGVVWYSKINRFESVPESNYIRIRSEADDRPQRIIEHFGGLLVFFQKSIWYIDLQSADPILWIPRKLNTDFGCPFPMTIIKGKLPNQQIGVFYMAEDRSIRVLTGVGSDGIQLFDNIYTDKLSLPIDDILKADITQLNEVYLTFYDYKLYVSLENNLLVWDAQFGGEWTKYNLPINQKYIGVVDGELQMSASRNIYKLGYTDFVEPNVVINGQFLTTENWVLYTQDGSSLYVGAKNMIMKNVSGGYSSFLQNLPKLITNNYYLLSFTYSIPEGSVGYKFYEISNTFEAGTISGNGVFVSEVKYTGYSSPTSRPQIAFYSKGFITVDAQIGDVSLIPSSNLEYVYLDNLGNQNLLATTRNATLEVGKEYVFSVSYNITSGSITARASWFNIPVEGSYYFNDVITSNLGVYSQTFTAYNTNFYLTLFGPSSYNVSDISLTAVNDITRDIQWNYKTKVFGDSFEYYQDFDKIWLRGIQKTTSDIRVDYTCNNDLGYYSDYIFMTLYGDSIVNTGVNSLLGAGGRDIQLEISGSDYVRLDAFSIKRTLREE